eukprot:CAMPEP_0115455396 /NCGR_PEP_ID=MMETSP0271-20121206/44136_1 /TAXON_ID=71861 /ORGANISM="Scrippsiella trochoidea, Strain CCMP3099" /LENGTH=366 /DNA_ID=CAMNT_0002881849 /DNA_START=15 /DNA_END=1115 /DNA_ORIENTATION=+
MAQSGEKRKGAPITEWKVDPGTGKCVCFIRHAQALHNVFDENLWTPDNPLTEDGEKMCEAAREEWGARIFVGAELVVISPMTRALQTAYLISGKDTTKQPWIVTPMCAEKLSGATCDEGIPLDMLKKRLPWIAELQGVAELRESWWTEPRKEEELRVKDFLDFLQRRPEKKIVVVSHGAFLEYIVGYHLANAAHFMMEADRMDIVRESQRSLNIDNCLSFGFAMKSLHAVVDAPLWALRGIGTREAGLLEKAGLKTVKQLANWKCAKWAEAFYILAPQGKEGVVDVHDKAGEMNINAALVKDWEGYSLKELLDAPLSAFEGVTEAKSKTFEAIGLKTIRDLSTWKYYKWARAIVTLADVEKLDGSS